ncbi:MAG: ATP-binding protein [Planctomycetes bacterium]|nr:ATP-binding protein [Planctomycetota bacterium]
MNSRSSNELRRVLKIDLEGTRAAFLWGPRQVGKTTLVRQQFPKAKYYDLLDTELKTTLLLRPALLREELLANPRPLVIIDEIQKVPSLLDEVHWLIENTATKFILCGSSARKLRHGAANLLGGRAWRFELFPLTTEEIHSTDLERILNHGLIPRHYLASKPERSLKSYLLDYLEQEIHAEALLRNVPAFAKFLEAVGTSHGMLINYANIARDCGVSPKTAREYHQIVEDTLLGHTLPPWRRAKERRLIETAKFYLFDVGVVRALTGMRRLQAGTEEFGRFFEHFLIEEIRAYLSYREKDHPLSFWRTSTGYEVDLIIGDMEAALEFKAKKLVDARDLRNLKALLEEHQVKKAIAVSLEERPRRLQNGILVLPWAAFCKKLWDGDLV